MILLLLLVNTVVFNTEITVLPSALLECTGIAYLPGSGVSSTFLREYGSFLHSKGTHVNVGKLPIRWWLANGHWFYFTGHSVTDPASSFSVWCCFIYLLVHDHWVFRLSRKSMESWIFWVQIFRFDYIFFVYNGFRAPWIGGLTTVQSMVFCTHTLTNWGEWIHPTGSVSLEAHFFIARGCMIGWWLRPHTILRTFPSTRNLLGVFSLMCTVLATVIPK